jgi:Cu-Zn family superoxide dismutase
MQIMKTINAVLLLPYAILMACGRTEPPAITTAPAAADFPTTAITTASAQASLTGASGSSVNGELRLTAQGSGVTIVGEMSGLNPRAEHGFHVHERGDCSAPDATSAGEHFNPGHMDHGPPTETARHLGDLPNIGADSEGRATVSANLADATLHDGGPNDLVGKAFIVHEKRDDYITQPSGDAGAPIACGIVR